MENNTLYHIFREFFYEERDWFDEKINEFSNGKDFIYEDEEYIFTMKKEDNNLITKENPNIDYYYIIYSKNNDSTIHSVIFSKEDYIYDVGFYSDEFLNNIHDEKEFNVLIYGIDDALDDVFDDYGDDTITKNNLDSCEFASEIKTLFKFFFSHKKVRLKLVVNQCDFVRKLLN